jgi:acyl-CoA thioesterase-1
MRVITGIGDSIVDSVGRCSVTEPDQWMYRLMVRLGEANISMQPLLFSVTPNVLDSLKMTTNPELANGNLTTFYPAGSGSYKAFFGTTYQTGSNKKMFAARVYSSGDPYRCTVSISHDDITYYPMGDIAVNYTHMAGQWDFVNWVPSNGKYVRFDFTSGNPQVAELQVIANVNNDRGMCLNKMVGENYTFQNVGLGSEKTEQALLRFRSDVIDTDSDTVVILSGINDIYQKVPIQQTQQNFSDMFDLADAAGITVLPCTLLPYNSNSLTPERFQEIFNSISVLNAWIRSTAQTRRYGVIDWFTALENPIGSGTMPSTMSCDGVHTSLAGQQVMANTFDLSQLSVLTYDLYANGLVEVPLTVVRDYEEVVLSYGNNVETSYQIHGSTIPGDTEGSNSLLTTTSLKEYRYTTSETMYYRVKGVNTGIWSEEVAIEGQSLVTTSSASLAPFPMILGRW